MVKKQAKSVDESKLSASEPHVQSKSIKGHQEHSEPTHTVVDVHDRQVYSGNYTFDANIYCDYQ